MMFNSAPAPAVPVKTMPVETEPLIDAELEEIVQTDYESMCRVVVWNDDVHEFDYVVRSLAEHFNLSVETAFEKTWQIHHFGKSALDQGSRNEMELHVMVLESRYGLTATVEKDD